MGKYAKYPDLAEIQYLPFSEEIEQHERKQFNWFCYKLLGAVTLFIIGLIAIATL